jgi:hypothetical protein
MMSWRKQMKNSAALVYIYAGSFEFLSGQFCQCHFGRTGMHADARASLMAADALRESAVKGRFQKDFVNLNAIAAFAAYP